MVTIKQQLAQVSEQETELARLRGTATQRRKEIREAEERIGRLTAPRGSIKSQLELAKTVGIGGVGRALTTRRRAVKKQRTRGLSSILQAEQEVARFEKQLSVADAPLLERRQLLEDIQLGERIAFDTATSFGASRRAIGFAQEFAQFRKAKVQSRERVQALSKEGLTPLFRDSQLVGFESEKTRQTIPLQSLGFAQPSAIDPLVEAKVIRIVEPSSLQSLAPQPSDLRSQSLAPQPSDLKGDKTFKERVEDFSLLASQVGSPSLVGVGVLGFRPKESVETFAGFTEEIIPKTKGEVVATAVLGGVGGLFGVALKGGGVLLSKFAPKIVSPISKLFKVGGVGLGGFIAGMTTAELFGATSSRQAGGILGRTAREVGAFAFGARAVDFAFKPQVLKIDPPPKISFKSQTTLLNIRKGGQQLDVGAFSVTGFRSPQKAFVAPRISELSRGLFGVKPSRALADLSFAELKVLQPAGKVVQLQPPSTTVSVVEPFFIKGGKIIKPTRRGGFTTEIQTFKATPSRREPTIISKLEGSVERGGIDVGGIDTKLLDALTRRSFAELQKVRGGQKGIDLRFEIQKVTGKRKDLDIRFGFPKGAQLQKGGIVVTDIAKITSKDLTILPTGRRVTRGDITSVQRQRSLTQFESREFGLKEVETLSERIGVVDVTFPRTLKGKGSGIPGRAVLEPSKGGGVILSESKGFSFPAPKRVDIIKGKVRRFEIELPELGGTTQIIQGTKPIRTTTTLQGFDQKLNVKAIQTSIGSVAKLQKGLLRGRPRTIRSIVSGQQRLSSLPTIVGGRGLVQSQFAGRGQFERTDGGIAPPKSIERSLTSGFETTALISGTGASFKFLTKDLSKEITKTLTKDVTKQLTKLSPKLVTKLSPKLIQKQTTKQVTRLITKQVTKFPVPRGAFVFGLPTVGGFSPFLPKTGTGRRPKTKKPKTRRRVQSPISVSFTAQTLGLVGKFPTERVVGLGLTPQQFRVIPRRKAPRRPKLAGVRTRTRRRKRR